jgi:hypothetical protein
VSSAVLECVPNVSEGRDRRLIERLGDAIRGVAGVKLADVHADPDHHRSVFTFMGAPGAVEAAALALAEAVFSSPRATGAGGAGTAGHLRRPLARQCGIARLDARALPRYAPRRPALTTGGSP